MNSHLILILNLVFACSSSEPPSQIVKETDRHNSVMNRHMIIEKVEELSLKKEERVWERIPWMTSFEEAQKTSQASNRPIFLFSMHGDLDGRSRLYAESSSKALSK